MDGGCSFVLIWRALYSVLGQWDLSLLTFWRLNAPKCPSKYHNEQQEGWIRKAG
jgi:hypothetical protein